MNGLSYLALGIGLLTETSFALGQTPSPTLVAQAMNYSSSVREKRRNNTRKAGADERAGPPLSAAVDADETWVDEQNN
jgi:hypothetical protein